MCLGQPRKEIILNENSVWNGTFEDRINNASLEALPEVRQLLMNGNLTEAGQLVLRDMAGIPTESRAYSDTNDLVLDFGHFEDNWENYERWLDTLDGNTGLSYDYDGVTYSSSHPFPIMKLAHSHFESREVIAPFPSSVIAVRLGASKNSSINVNVALYRARGVLRLGASLDSNMITMDVGGPDTGSIAFTSGVRVVSDGGQYQVTASMIEAYN